MKRDVMVNGMGIQPTTRTAATRQIAPRRPPVRKGVTQQMLSELQRLRELCKQRDELRVRITKMLSEGAPIEPGVLRAHIAESEIRRITWQTLEEIVGFEEAENIREQVEPTTTRRLLITRGCTAIEDDDECG